jgi:HSP20 family protein
LHDTEVCQDGALNALLQHKRCRRKTRKTLTLSILLECNGKPSGLALGLLYNNAESYAAFGNIYRKLRRVTNQGGPEMGSILQREIPTQILINQPTNTDTTMTLMRYNPRFARNWSPFDSLMSLRSDLDRLFGEIAGDERSGFSGWAPALDLYETDDHIIAKVEAPGMKKEDFNVSIENGVLSISGERESEQETEKGGRSERYFGSFARSVSLNSPVNTEAAKASYKDGILTVNVPKAEEARPKAIQVEE